MAIATTARASERTSCAERADSAGAKEETMPTITKSRILRTLTGVGVVALLVGAAPTGDYTRHDDQQYFVGAVNIDGTVTTAGSTSDFVVVAGDDASITGTDDVSLEHGSTNSIVNIATALFAADVNIGNATGVTDVDITAGTGGVTLQSTTTGDVTLDPSDDLLCTVADDETHTMESASAIFSVTGTAGFSISLGTDDTTADTIAIGSAKDDVDVDGEDIQFESADDTHFLSTSAGGIFNFGTGANGYIFNFGTDDTLADDINIGSALDDVDITGASSFVAGTGDPLTITGNAASTWSTTAGDLILSADAASVTITGNEAAAGQVALSATGVIAGNAMTLATSDGGISVAASGSVNGDLMLSAADDATLNGGSAGSLITIGGNTQGNVLNVCADNTTADDINVGSALDTVAITSSVWSVDDNGAFSGLGDLTCATGLTGGWDLSCAASAAATPGQSIDLTGQAGGTAATDSDGQVGGAVSATGGVGSALNGGGANDGSGGDVVLLGGARGGATGSAVHGIVRVGNPTVSGTRATDYLAVGGGFEVDGIALFAGSTTLGDNAADALTITGSLSDVNFQTGLGGGADIGSAAAAADTAGQSLDLLGQLGGAASTGQVGRAGGLISITGGAGTPKDGAGATDGDGGDVVLLGGARGGTTGGTEVHGIVRVGSPTVGSTKATNVLAIGGALEVDGAARFDGGLVMGDTCTGSVSANAVSCSGASGVITDDGTDINLDASRADITWTNARIAATSVVLLTVCGPTRETNTNVTAQVVPGAGTATLQVRNTGTANFTSAGLMLCFLVLN